MTNKRGPGRPKGSVKSVWATKPFRRKDMHHVRATEPQVAGSIRLGKELIKSLHATAYRLHTGPGNALILLYVGWQMSPYKQMLLRQGWLASMDETMAPYPDLIQFRMPRSLKATGDQLLNGLALSQALRRLLILVWKLGYDVVVDDERLHDALMKPDYAPQPVEEPEAIKTAAPAILADDPLRLLGEDFEDEFLDDDVDEEDEEEGWE